MLYKEEMTPYRNTFRIGHMLAIECFGCGY